MRIPVDEKNLKIIQSNIEDDLLVGEKTEPFRCLSIYRACFTNARVM